MVRLYDGMMFVAAVAMSTAMDESVDKQEQNHAKGHKRYA